MPRLRRVVEYYTPTALLGLHKMNFQTGSNLVKLTVEKFGDFSIRARPKTIFQITTPVRGKGQRDNV